jgi:hypothetical protein
MQDVSYGMRQHLVPYGVRFILILPDRDDPTVAIGHSLRPLIKGTWRGCIGSENRGRRAPSFGRAMNALREMLAAAVDGFCARDN